MAYDKVKARWARIKRVYGLTKEDYERLDSGSCPICLREWSVRVRPVVDHDHVSKEVRGILCAYCNHRVLGRNRDALTIHRMASYLDIHTGLFVPTVKKKKRIKKRPSGRT